MAPKTKRAQCVMQCGRDATAPGGYCRSCYARSRDPLAREKRTKVDTTCLVCGAKIHVYDGQRYCDDHKRMRAVQAPASVIVETRWKPVEFTELEPSEAVLIAARSIRIYRPDGALDEERTSTERGRWLTKKLQGPWTEPS